MVDKGDLPRSLLPKDEHDRYLPVSRKQLREIQKVLAVRKLRVQKRNARGQFAGDSPVGSVRSESGSRREPPLETFAARIIKSVYGTSASKQNRIRHTSQRNKRR
jgi:hypothetical protein